MNEAPPKKRYRSLFPKPLGQCVEPLTRPVFKAQGIASARLITDWEKIVGSEMARRCMPQKLSFPGGKTTDGCLAIGVENGFAPELQHKQHIILEKLAGYFGYRAVSRISLQPLPAKIPAAPKAKRPPSAPALDAGCVAQAQAAQDPELREALTSLAKALSSPGT